MSPIRKIAYLHARMFPKFHESKISSKLTVGFSLRLKYGFFKFQNKVVSIRGFKTLPFDFALAFEKNAETI